jgi:hypothetical protein
MSLTKEGVHHTSHLLHDVLSPSSGLNTVLLLSGTERSSINLRSGRACLCTSIVFSCVQTRPEFASAAVSVVLRLTPPLPCMFC